MAKILLADDEPALRANMARFLTGLGHDVSVAEDGRAALALVDEALPDLIITDINMPDMDGIELLNALRKRGSRLPVIAVSGGGRVDRSLLLSSASMLGAVITLSKPFALGDLERAVADALAAR